LRIRALAKCGPGPTIYPTSCPDDTTRGEASDYRFDGSQILI
jgi:hypothetical protein